MEKKLYNKSRRRFLKSSGSLVIGFPMLAGCWSSTESATISAASPIRNIDPSRVDAWLEVLKDGSIRIFTGKMELGQGISVAVSQVAAEELNTEVEKVEVFLAETGVTPDEGYTVGSNSVESTVKSIRLAAATARQKLLSLAAKKLRVNAGDLAVKDGTIQSAGSKALTFYELLEGRQITDKVNVRARLKPIVSRQWVGKAVPRKEVGMMVRGQQVFIQDLRFESMMHARIVRPPAYGVLLESIDEEALKNEIPGIEKIVVDGSFVGIIAADEYDVVKGQEYLRQNIRWSASKPLTNGEPMTDLIKSLAVDTETVVNKGSASFDSTGTITAQYFKPYIMHGSIGPSCALAIYENEKLTVWSHSQGVYPLRAAISDLVGLSLDQVHVKGVPGAGCYGHNGADDVAADVALLAMAFSGRHIRLQWSRSDEHGWEPYGSAMMISLSANLDKAGKIVDWGTEIWSDTHVARPRSEAGGLLGARYLERPFSPRPSGYLGGTYRNAEPYYDIPNVKIDIHSFEGPLRTSALRGLGAYANLFALESFMDELAVRAGEDPLSFRLKHSKDPRFRAITEKLRHATSGQKLTTGEGIGYGVSRYENGAAYCGVAAKLLVDKKGKVKLQKLWGVIDAGEAINPDGLKNQTEGGMIQSASWTLMEAVKFDRRHVTSLHWGSYPIIRFDDIPQVEVEVIDRPETPPLGAGEAAQGPTAAAIANAIYQACGKRVRALPVSSAKLQDL